MEILEIVSGAQINGAVVHCALLCREFARLGHSVTLVCRTGSKIKEILCDEKIRVIESDLHRLPLDELRRISTIVRDSRIEVIHTHMTRAHNFGVVLRRFCGVPCVATAHSHIIQPLTWMFNDHVIAVSDATKRFQLKWNLVRPANIDTVHGFMDYESQAAVPAEAGADARASLGIEPDVPVVGIIGDIIPRKGHLYLVRALAEIKRTIPNVLLLIVGDPKRNMGRKYDLLVREEAQRLGVTSSIQWTGYRTDVASILRALDVYVLASLDEMFPVAVLEAMSARLPIVATKVGGVPECLTDRENGLLSPSADAGALALAIRSLLEDRGLAHSLGERAHALARDRFSVQSQAPRIEAVFERVIAKFDRARAGTGAAGSAP